MASIAKRRERARGALALLIAIAPLGMAACESRLTPPLAVSLFEGGDGTGAFVVLPASLELRVGGTAQLSASRPSTFSTDAPTVATVTTSGLVTGVGAGTAVITATATDGSARASATVRVLTP